MSRSFAHCPIPAFRLSDCGLYKVLEEENRLERLVYDEADQRCPAVARRQKKVRHFGNSSNQFL